MSTNSEQPCKCLGCDEHEFCRGVADQKDGRCLWWCRRNGGRCCAKRLPQMRWLSTRSLTMLDPKTTHALDQYLGEMERLTERGFQALLDGRSQEGAEAIATDIMDKTETDAKLLLVLAITQMAEDRWRAALPGTDKENN